MQLNDLNGLNKRKFYTGTDRHASTWSM